jgi:hypothetical protein
VFAISSEVSQKWIDHSSWFVGGLFQATSLAFQRNALQFRGPLKSFFEVDSHFPLGNLPVEIFKTRGMATLAGVAIGHFVVDLPVLEEAWLFRTSRRFRG